MIRNNCLIVVLLCFATATYASTTNNNIHDLTITTGRTTGVDIFLWTSVGKEKNNECLYEKDTEKQLKTVYKELYQSLNGDKLKTIAGPDYDCAKTNVQEVSSGKISSNYFKLLHNETTHDYIGTDPGSSNINILN